MKFKLLSLFFLQIFCVLSLSAQNDNTLNSEEKSISETQENEIFKDYPWLLDKIDLESCQGYSVTLAKRQAGSKTFIFVNDGELTTMYTEEGKQYCKDGKSFRCEEHYQLNMIVKEWECVE